MTNADILESEKGIKNELIKQIYDMSFEVNLPELLDDLELVTKMLKIKYYYQEKQKTRNIIFVLEKELNQIFQILHQ